MGQALKVELPSSPKKGSTIVVKVGSLHLMLPYFERMEARWTTRPRTNRWPLAGSRKSE
jgi:hypothetical protein